MLGLHGSVQIWKRGGWGTQHTQSRTRGPCWIWAPRLLSRKHTRGRPRADDAIPPSHTCKALGPAGGHRSQARAHRPSLLTGGCPTWEVPIPTFQPQSPREPTAPGVLTQPPQDQRNSNARAPLPRVPLITGESRTHGSGRRPPGPVSCQRPLCSGSTVPLPPQDL